MYPRTAATDSSFSSPNVESASWPHAVTFSVARPRSTSVTCPVPHPCFSRATDDRIFCATVVESSTTSSSFRHQSHAPQLARV